MHVCRKRGCPKLAHNMTIYGKSIKCVESQKFLGMIIDNSVTWTKYIQEIKISCNKKLDLLKHLSHKNWGTDRQFLLRLYIMIIKPKIDYGCEAYSSASKTTLGKLDPIQNVAIRIATGAFKTTPIISLQSEAGNKSLETCREIKIMNYIARSLANPNHPMYEQIEGRIAEAEQEYEVEENRRGIIDRAVVIMKKYQLNFEEMIKERTPNGPPWRANVKVCGELFQLKKAEMSGMELRTAFNDHIRSHEGKPMYFTDGSKTDKGVL